MSLSLYRKKHNVMKTAEPVGRVRATGGENVFVVQKHHARALHFDFRLAHRGVLKSWAVPKGPPRTVGEKRLAIMVEDHPLEYRHFEGTISSGNYGAGTVTIWDKGTYRAEGSLAAGFRRGSIKIFLAGKKLKGPYVLVRLKSPEQWLLIKGRR